jgi:hypothetical protein
MTHGTTVPDALMDALGMPAPPESVQRARTRHVELMPERRNGQVQTVRQGIHEWVCSTCGRVGYGGLAMLDHGEESGHLHFDPRP